MKLYKHTLVSAALVLTGLGSAQAQLSAPCPIGMALSYKPLTGIPYCVGVPNTTSLSGVAGTKISNGPAPTSPLAGAQTTVRPASSYQTPQPNISAQDYASPTAVPPAMQVVSPADAAAVAKYNAATGQSVTELPALHIDASTPQGTSISEKGAYYSHLIDLGYTPWQIQEAAANYSSAASAAYIAAQAPPTQVVSPADAAAVAKYNAATGQSVTELPALHIDASTPQGTSILEKGAYYSHLIDLGYTPWQIQEAAANYSSAVSAAYVAAQAPPTQDLVTQAPNTPALVIYSPNFTTEQVASYLRDNAMWQPGEPQAPLDKIGATFGIPAGQLQDARMMLINGTNTAGIDAAHNAYLASATPQQLADNRAFGGSQGLPPANTITPVTPTFAFANAQQAQLYAEAAAINQNTLNEINASAAEAQIVGSQYAAANPSATQLQIDQATADAFAASMHTKAVHDQAVMDFQNVSHGTAQWSSGSAYQAAADALYHPNLTGVNVNAYSWVAGSFSVSTLLTSKPPPSNLTRFPTTPPQASTDVTHYYLQGPPNVNSSGDPSPEAKHWSEVGNPGPYPETNPLYVYTTWFKYETSAISTSGFYPNPS